MSADYPPNATIYINNLNDKVNINKVKSSLYLAFGQFGPILDVVISKRFKLRGQAWVVFEDVPAASQAKKAMNGFPLNNKPMRISFAKTKMMN